MPLVLKDIVDALDPTQAVLVLPLALLVAYGVLRLSTTLFAELRDVVFVRVTQRAIRRVALTVFRHLHSLACAFTSTARPAACRATSSAARAASRTLLTYMLFSIIPVILEFALVAAVLLAKFDWRFAAVTFAAVAVYIGFTVSVTEWRMDDPPPAPTSSIRRPTRAPSTACSITRR